MLTFAAYIMLFTKKQKRLCNPYLKPLLLYLWFGEHKKPPSSKLYIYGVSALLHTQQLNMQRNSKFGRLVPINGCWVTKQCLFKKRV